MDKVSNKIKEQRFRYPDEGLTGFGRKLACTLTENSFWIAAQMEHSRTNRILLKKFSGSKSEMVISETSGYCQQPALAALPGDRAALVWNESDGDHWKIQLATVSGNSPLKMPKVVTVRQSKNLCLSPAVAAIGANIVVTWPELDINNDIRIFVSINQSAPQAVSEPGIDAMRPVITACGRKAVLAWDQYSDGHYEIAVAQLTGNGEMSHPKVIGNPDERWLCPILAGAGKNAYLTWLGLREVSDSLGIADHFPFGMVAEILPAGIQILDDYGSRGVADMREGVLAEHTYKGYLGLRRRPQITVSDTGDVYCCWETRIESEGTAVLGHLTIRKYLPETGWAEPEIICTEGYGYTVPPSFIGNILPVAYFKFKQTGPEIVQAAFPAIIGGKAYRTSPERWKRWKKSEITALDKTAETVKTGNNEYKLFWADTHCHSNFSADAEGEPDEIIHFARDIAKLDALCVIDNDYYPNKTLSEAEWRVHNAYAEHFTQPGKFVLFPGFEFTFHRDDLNPDFNHRCVIYPRPGGKLLRRIDPGSRNDRELLASLLKTDAMAYPHHSSYEIIDQTKEWNIEALSSWRICLAESDFTIRQLQAGKKLGFIGSSDAHRCNPGLGGALTGLYAPELTPEALFDAYRNRRIIATQGFAAFIDFQVADIFIGGDGECSGPPVATAKIIAPEVIEYVEIVRDGTTVFKAKPGKDNAEIEFKDDSAEPGNHFYFLKLKLVGDPGYNFPPQKNTNLPFTLDSKYPHNLAKARGVFAWTSPVWINVS